MFLPSLPIILPFISSLGKSTTDTVVSATWSAEHFWTAYVIISLAFLSAFSLASLSISLTINAASCSASLLILSTKISFASSAVKPDILSSSSFCLSWIAVSLACFNSKSLSFFCKLSSFFSIFKLFASRVSSFLNNLFSVFWSSALLSLVSLSSSFLSLCDSSFASSKISFFLVSASFTDSSIILLASISALPIFFSDIFLRASIPATVPTPIPPMPISISMNNSTPPY